MEHIAYSNQLVFSASGQILAIGAKADTPDIQVATGVCAVVLQDTDLFSSDNIIDLGGLVASRRDILAIHTEANAAHYTLVGQGVNKVHVKHARNNGVEDDEPIVPSLLVLSRQSLDVKVTKSVGGRVVRLGHPSMVRSRVRSDLGRLAWTARAGIGNGGIDLRRGRATRRRSPDAALAGAGAGGAGRGLRREAARSGTLRILRLEGRRLRRGRGRRTLESGRRLRHLMRRGLLLLRWGRRRDRTALAALTRHDGAEGVRAHADSRGRCLRWASVGRRADHSALGSASAGLFELATEVSDLFFEPVKQRLSVGVHGMARLGG